MTKQQIICHANEELLSGNLDVIPQVFSPDYVAHADRGHRFIRAFAKQLSAAVTKIKVEEITILLESGDTVAWRRRLSGKHEADLKGIPPSGRKVKWTDMVVSRFAADKIAEDWVVSGLAAQLMFRLPAPN